MLVLLNQEIIDVGDPMTTLQAIGSSDFRGIPSVGQAVLRGQDAAFAARGLENAHEDVRRGLAAYVALAGPANCCIFLCPPNARSPRDVAVRLAEAPMDTLVYLWTLQQDGRLTAGLINHHVWNAMAGISAA